MSLRIVFVREARAHLAEIARWWRETRPGQELFERELTKTLTFLAQQPELGAPYLEGPQSGVRRTSAPPEGDPHFDAKVDTRQTLRSYFERIGRKVYFACELPVYYSGEEMLRAAESCR